MPKLKTKSSVKKRFSITSSGHVRRSHSGKRHGMIKRTNKQIRNLRGTALMSKVDEVRVLKFFCPYGIR